MGKQSNNITYVSQDQFNKDLDESLNILIDDGADDKTIKLYIDDYKSRFAVKKKDGTKPNSTSTSVSQKQVSEQTNGSSGTVKQSFRLPTEKEFEEGQKRGEFAPNRSMPKSKETQYDLEGNTGKVIPETKKTLPKLPTKEELQKEQEKGFYAKGEENVKRQEISKDFEEKGFTENTKQKFIDGNLVTEEKRVFSKDKEQLKLDIDTQIAEEDLDNPVPFKFYSTYNKPPIYNPATRTFTEVAKDPFVDSEFGDEKLKAIGIDPADFDGYLNEKGFKKDFLEKEEKGLFEGEGNNLSGADIQLAREIQKQKMFANYIAEKNERDFKVKKLNAKKENLDRSSTDAVKVEKTTIFEPKKIENYLENEFPLLSKKLKERDEESRKILEQHNKGEAGIWYGTKNTLKSGWNGFVDRINNLSATVYDKIGMDETAEEVRMMHEENQLLKPDTREVGYVSGKSVKYDGVEYLVDENGQIYDKDKKIRVTDLMLKPAYESILRESKKGKEDWIFSPQGTSMQLGGVLGDMIVQVALTRGIGGAISSPGISQISNLSKLSKIPISKDISSAIIAQSSLGYSQGLEETIKAAKDAGLNDNEAEMLANDAAQRMAILYAVTAPISPQTKATESLFGNAEKDLIRKAILSYRENGKKGFVETLKNGIPKLAKAGTEISEEGLKELFQENIQQTGEALLVNKETNKQAGKEILKDSISVDDFINTSILSFASGGLITQMKLPTLFKNNNVEQLRTLNTLSQDYSKFEQNLDNLVKNGSVDSESAEKLKKDVKIFSSNKNKIPTDTKPEVALDLMRGLDEISKLEDKKKTLDASFHENIDEQIKSKREEIKSLYNKSNQDAVQQEATTTETKQEAQPQAEAEKVEIKNEGKADAPTKENIDERLRINHPFYEKVSDVLDKLGLISKFNPETKEGDVVGGYTQPTSDGGFSVGNFIFSKDGSVSFLKDGARVEFDKNGNVISENTKEVAQKKNKIEIEGTKESITNLEKTRDSEAFKYKEVTETDVLGNRKKVKRLKTTEELKESIDKINDAIDKAKSRLTELEKNKPQEASPVEDVVAPSVEKPSDEIIIPNKNNNYKINKGTIVYRSGEKGQWFSLDKEYSENGFEGKAREVELSSELNLLDITDGDFGTLYKLATENELRVLNPKEGIAKNSKESLERDFIMDEVLKRNGYDGIAISDEGENGKEYTTIKINKNLSPDFKNEATPETNTPTNRNVPLGNNVVEPSGTTEQEINQASNIQPADNSRNVEVKREIKIADKGQSYTVEKTDLGLVITDKKGKKPSKVTERKILDEYVKTINFTKGTRVDDSFESSAETYIDDVATKSQNPSEIAEAIAYVENADMNDGKVDPIQIAIANALGEKSVEKSSFTNINDRNNINQSIALQYFAQKGKGKGLDEIAMEVEYEVFGDYNANNPRITEEDIANFIVDNPRGAIDFLNKNRNEALEKLKTAFTDVTGLPAKPQFIQKAIDQQIELKNQLFAGNSLYALSEEDLLSLDNDYQQFKQFENNEQQQQQQQQAINETPEARVDIKNTAQRGKESRVQEARGTKASAEQREEVTPEEKPSLLDEKIEKDKLSDVLDWLDGLKLDPNDLNATLPFLPQSWNMFIEAVKLAVKAGKTINDAIKEAIKKLQSEGIGNDEINAIVEKFTGQATKKAESGTFERKEGKKSLLSRVYEGENKEPLNSIIEYIGLDYKVENQEQAQNRAKKFVKQVGINKALEAVRNNLIKGAEKAFVYAEILDQIVELSESANIDEIGKIQEDYNVILEESLNAFDEEARDAGRFISALNKIYNNSRVRYNLTKQINQYKALNKGVIDEETLIKFNEADRKLKEIEQKLKEAEAKLIEQEQQLAIKNIEEAIAREIKNKVSNKTKATKIANQIRRAKIQKPDVFNASTGASLVWDGAVEIVAKSIEAGGTIADAVYKGVEYIKNTDWYKNATKDTQKKAIESFTERMISDSTEQTSSISISEDGKIRIPESVVKDYVRQGITDINEISQRIIDDFFSGNEDITIREVRDAITRYGKTINQSKDEINAKVRELKRLGKLISAMEDVLEGKRPLKSGLQRDKPTQVEREMMRELKDKMRDLPLDEADLEIAWKNALDTYKQRLKNQIEDLEKQIENKEKSKVKRESVKLDEEAKALKEQVKVLRETLNNLVGKPELTEEQKINRATRQLENAIDNLTNQIANGELDYKDKPTPVNSARLTELRKQKDDLNKQLQKAREESGIVEKRRLKQAKQRLKNQIELYQKKIQNKDFSKKEPKPLPADVELQQLQAEKIKWQEVYDKAKYEAELRDRKWQDYARELLVGIIGLPRLIMAGGEMSMMLIQGGIPTISLATRNPKLLAQIFAKAFISIGSNEKFLEYERAIKSDPNYMLMKNSKLALTETDYQMELREETFIGSNIVYGTWNAIGKGIQIGSVKILGKKEFPIIGSTFVSMIKKNIETKKIPISEQFKNINLLLAFERGNTIYMNEIRKARFMDGVKMLKMEGKNEIDHKEDFKTLAKAINTLTGRTSIGKLENVNDYLSIIFFSFKNTFSVFQQLNPWFYSYVLRNNYDEWTKPSVAQKIAVKDMVTFVTITTSMMFLLQAAAGEDDEGNPIVEIEKDPRSSDFMTLKIKGKDKDTRFDPWHGMKPQVVFFARSITGEQKGMKKGKVEIKRIGLGYKADTHWDNMMKTYLYNKFSPSMQMVYKQMNSEVDKDGNKTYYGKDFQERFSLTPMYIESLREIEEQDPDAFTRFLAALGFFGLNSSTY